MIFFTAHMSSGWRSSLEALAEKGDQHERRPRTARRHRPAVGLDHPARLALVVPTDSPLAAVRLASRRRTGMRHEIEGAGTIEVDRASTSEIRLHMLPTALWGGQNVKVGITAYTAFYLSAEQARTLGADLVKVADEIALREATP